MLFPQKYALASLAFLFFVMPRGSFAAELRILDTNGLIRAIKEIQAPVSVTIDIQSKVPVENVILSNSNGLASDIGATRMDQHTIIFNGVAEGIWKIDAHGQPLAVTKVEVKE